MTCLYEESIGKLAIENNDYGMCILLQGLEEKGRM
jgi:hypothetical protein